MSDLPYTEEQHEVFRAAAGRNVELDDLDCRLILQGIHEAGITVTFPEPRYRVERDGSLSWDVVDTERDDGAVVSFWVDADPDAERHVREYADRLNREAADA